MAIKEVKDKRALYRVERDRFHRELVELVEQYESLDKGERYSLESDGDWKTFSERLDALQKTAGLIKELREHLRP